MDLDFIINIFNFLEEISVSIFHVYAYACYITILRYLPTTR